MKALIIIDVQNDFLPGGALAVPEGDAVIPLANELMPLFPLVVATQDWHPANHQSFASQHAGQMIGNVVDLNGLAQILWPDHCVQDSSGAEFSAELHTEEFDHVVRKGTDSEIDSYSGFFDNGHRKATGLHELLQSHDVQQVFLLGLATDYCVKWTALDAKQLGYEVFLIQDACRGVNLKPQDVSNAFKEMESAGVRVIESSQVRKMVE